MDSKMQSNLIKEVQDNFFIPTKKIGTSFNHTLVINEFGDLFGWGSNENDILGLNVELVEYIKDATLFKFFKEKQLKVVDVAMGESHMLAILKQKDGLATEAGELYSWGLDLYGRLGYLTEMLKNNDIEVPESEKYVFRRIPFCLNIPHKISRVSCGKDFSACLTVEGKLYTWGNNTWGNLGINSNQLDEMEGNYMVKLPTLVKHLENEQLIQIVCGDKHMLALTNQRRIYSWGDGKNGALGHGNKETVGFPVMIQDLSFEDIIFICAGVNTSAAINSKGQLYTWGNGQFGKLGLGDNDLVKSPRKVTEPVLMNDRVFYVSMGYYHTLCCSLEGRTFSMGYSFKGRLGNMPKDECDKKITSPLPRSIKELEGIQITQLIAGNFHSLAVSSKGKLFGWGENKNFVFGLVSEEDENRKVKSEIYYYPVDLPVNKSIIRVASDVEDLFKTYFLSSSNLQQNYKISKKFKIMKIACGATHTLALTGTGDVLSWGYGTAGQLGQGRDIDALPNPTLVNFNTDTKMEKIYAGRNHCMVITALTSMVYTWGEGISGQLGYNKRNAYEPVLVDYLTGRNVLKGCLGVDNSAIITTRGEVYVWGSNSSSKLGLSVKNPTETFPVLNSNLKNVKTISLGLEHTGVINDKGEIFMWGNNLYGQLGLGDYYSIELPAKMKTNLSFLKVKCAAYHTLFMDSSNYVYVSGKARLNLASEDYKNKPSPDVIEDFKLSNKGRKLQVGYGNSLVLTYSEEIFGFGKNDYSKAGGELVDEFVMKNARPITIETVQGNSRKKVAIFKIFANYDSCFALSYLGDVYAWGNPRLFRLTGGFGDEISRSPKTIEIEWLQKGSKNEPPPEENQEEENEEEDPILNENLDERQILTILNKNLKILSFKELYVYMRRMGTKYDDKEIISRDESVIKEITLLLSKLSSEFSTNFDEIRTNFMDVDQLFGIRFKELRPPMAKNTLMHTSINKDILSYIDEVEKIYSYLFIHPCVIRSLIDNIQQEEYNVFMEGIKPLFRGLEIKPKQSENFQSMTYISLVRMSMDIDYISFKSNLDFYCTYKQTTIIELLIKVYLYNYFHRSYLIDILKQSLNFLKEYSNSPKEINNTENLDKVYQVVCEKYDRLYFIEPTFLIEVFELTKLFLLDLENNYHKFPHGFIYCFLYMKKYIKKDQLAAINRDKKFLKMKLVSCMMRFFFSNIVGRSLQSIFADGKNDIFLCRSLNLDLNSTNRRLVENYLKIIGELMERISCNELYNLKTFDREDEDEEILDEENQNMKSTLNNLNNFIKEMNVKLFVRFIEKFPKMKYNFKKNFLSSLVYYHLNITPLKILIEYDVLINFLKYLSEKKSKFCGEMQFQIFELIKDKEEVHKDKKQEALALKIRESLKKKSLKLTLDVKHLSNPLGFSSSYVKILETNQKNMSQEIYQQPFKKCTRCHVLLPSVFLKGDSGTEKIIKPFKSKIKKQEFIYFGQIIMHRDFKVKIVKTLKDVSSNIRYLKQLFEDNYLTETDEYIYLEPLQNYILDTSQRHLKNDEEKMLYFVNDMHNHLRKKINHMYKTSENQKLILDIEDAVLQLKEFLKLFSRNLDECKGSLKLLNNSLDIEEDKEKLEATLTHKKKNKPIYTNDGCFRYRTLDYSIAYLRKNYIMHMCEENNYKEEEIFLQISSNPEKKYFDLKIRHRKTKDILKSAFMSYEEYFEIFLNSTLYRNVYFQNYGKFNFYNIRGLIYLALSK